jgi:ArsR family transcriptional regulator
MSLDLVPAAQPVEWLERVEQPDEQLIRALSALANPVRLRILKLLLESEGCFCGDLVPVFGLAQSTISHHLKTLREAGLVTACEQGTFVSYCANRDRIEEVKLALSKAL